MKREQKTLAIVAVLAAAVGSAHAAVDYYDINDINGSLSGSIVAAQDYTNAWVVIGWTDDNGGGLGVTDGDPTFDGTPLSNSLRDSSSPYDGNNGGYNMWYASVGDLSSGSSYDWALTRPTGGNFDTFQQKLGKALWIVDNVVGVRDTAYASYLDEENGSNGPIAGGFNLATNTNAAGSPNAGDAAVDTVLATLAGDVVVGFVGSGAGLNQMTNDMILGPLGEDQVSDVWQSGKDPQFLDTGGSFYAHSGVTAADNAEFALQVDGGWFRFASGAVAFEVVPEPVSAGLIALGSLALVARRRR